MGVDGIVLDDVDVLIVVVMTVDDDSVEVIDVVSVLVSVVEVTVEVIVEV